MSKMRRLLRMPDAGVVSVAKSSQGLLAGAPQALEFQVQVPCNLPGDSVDHKQDLPNGD
jgi:hypothetical protein